MKTHSSLLLLTAGLSAISCGSKEAKEDVKPNVLLILTDDQGWGDFGFNGNEIVQTPVLDSLCAQSAYLTNFHVSPLSASTRAGLLTGRYHLATGAMSVTRSSENMHPDEQTIAEIFKANDYATGCFGKWHNGAHYPQDPNGQGFDEFVGFCAGHLTNYFDARLQHNQEFFNAEGFITDVLTDRAIDFIDSSVQNDTPFFCYVPYNAPHAPYQAPEEYYAKYKDLDIAGEPMTAAVYAMCENVDYNVGRLLSHIRAKGLDENTLIVFMTDNGPNNPRYNGVLRGKKGEMHEGGFKVPCLVYWKGKIEKMEIPQEASYIDILPTIIDLCGIESTPADNREISGVSLKGLLSKTEDSLEPRYLYTHRSTTDLELEPHNGVVYNNEYKLITFQNNRHELYNKIADPSETNNLIMTDTEMADSLISLYDSWFSSVLPEYERSISRTVHIGLLDTPAEIPAHEALMTGRTRYFTNIHGWAGDWMTDMAPQDTIYWDIVVDKASDYTIILQYSSIGSNLHTIALDGGEVVELKPYAPGKIESPDLYPRHEAYEQVWGEQVLGTLHLPLGKNRIALLFDSNSDIALGSLEVKGITVKGR